ncbi:hypothetical protein [Saccharobesus litoralis]|nr:hypothetical protein [Saccharobesus litoralis]
MIKSKTKALFTLGAMTCLTSCTANLEEYVNHKPQLQLERFFQGER